MENREVSLAQILEFRENKAAIQNEMVMHTSGGAVMSLGMNIPGPVKSGSLLWEAFHEGKARVEALIAGQGGTVVQRAVLEEGAGYAAIYLDGKCAGKFHPAFHGKVPSADHRDTVCTADTVILYGFLFLRTASGIDRNRERIWSGPGAYGHCNGSLQKLRDLYQPGGTRHISWNRTCGSGDQGSH